MDKLDGTYKIGKSPVYVYKSSGLTYEEFCKYSKPLKRKYTMKELEKYSKPLKIKVPDEVLIKYMTPKQVKSFLRKKHGK